MNILFLGYWGAEDGLSKATVFPHLRILSNIPGVGKVVYCSIERTGNKINLADVGDKVVHIHLYSGTTYLHKILDFLLLPKKLDDIVRCHAIAVCICRGAPAGSLGYLLHQKSGTPYVVESFEPHSQYMADAGVWSRTGLKYRFQRRWERLQLATARFVTTVSENYKNHLVKNGCDPERVECVPCAVDTRQFAFSEDRRARIRKQLEFSDSCSIGIYVGKFGGLYYDEESFKIFANAFRYIPDLRLVVLTPDNLEIVKKKLAREGIPSTQYYLAYVSHEMVPDFLSAADFAFAPCKPSPSSEFCSPVKIGEYWASGLPVLLTRGVGDDSRIIEYEGGGFTFDLSDKGSLPVALHNLRELLEQNNRAELTRRICILAHKYRNYERVRAVYERILVSR